MADMTDKTYTSVDFTTAYDLTAELKNTANELESSLEKADSLPDFQTLKSHELCGSFPGDFDKAIESLIENINKTITSTNTFLDQLKQQDDKLKGLWENGTEENTSGPKNNNNNNNYNNRNNNNNNNNNNNQNTEPKTEKPPKEKETEPKDKGVDNYKEQVEKFRTMSMSDLSEVVASLKGLAKDKNTTIDALLANDKYSESIKKILLKNTKISAELRKLIEEGTSISAVKALKNLLNGQIFTAVGLDDDTSAVLKSYLEKLAAQNNVTVEKLIDGSSGVIKGGLEALGAVVEATDDYTEKNVQEKMLAVQDGNDTKIDDLSMDVIRDEIAVVCEGSNLEYPELFAESSFSGPLMGCIDRLRRVATFMDGIANCSDKTMSSVLKTIIKG